MVTRRQVVISVGAGSLAAPLASLAQQQPVRVRRIGILLATSASDPEWARRIRALTENLRALGWIEGQNLALETRYAERKQERLPTLAAELVQAGVDVIVTQGAQPINAAREATSVIPIVMAQSGDAAIVGIVASLARPGGNITGLTLVATVQVQKRLQLIRYLSPSYVRIAAICSTSAAHRIQMQALELAASKLGITLQPFPNKTPEEVDASLQAAAKANAQIIFTMEDPLIESHRVRIGEFAMRQRIPVVGEFRPMVIADALMSYGANQVDLWRRAATYVDKILKGAKAAELPIEQPTRFDLILNMKTAKALGIQMPDSIMVQATELIE